MFGFGKSQPKHKLCDIKVGGKEVVFLVDKPPGTSNSYKVFVPAGYAGMAAGAVGSVTGKSILSNERRIEVRDGYAVFGVPSDDCYVLANLEARKPEDSYKAQSTPDIPKTLKTEEIMNRMERWKPPKNPLFLDVYTKHPLSDDDLPEED